MNKNFTALLFLCALISSPSCNKHSSAPKLFPLPGTGSGLKGWELNETNTGLAAGITENDCTALDLNGADAGKGEWIAGEGYYLYVYGNQTIEKRIITFTGYMRAPDGGTIFRNCVIRPASCQEGMPMITIDGATMENCVIDGSLLGIDNIAHTGIAANNSTIRKCLIHDCDAGIMASNSAGVTLIESNYIYNVLFQPGSDDHLAGCSIWSATGGGIRIINNRIVIDDAVSALHTSAAFFSQTLRGNISNIRIEGNLLASAGYVTRLTESAFTTSAPYEFINNRLLLITDYGTGYGYYAGSTGLTITPTWTDNYIYDPAAAEARGDLITIQ